MTTLKIFEYPDEILRKKAEEVTVVDDNIRRILSDMLETMYSSDGVGLAGNQVGLLKRLVVIDISGNPDKPEPLKLVNPKIVAHSLETTDRSEGCLSVPGQYAAVHRFKEVDVLFQDETGKKQNIKASGLLAVALQHEIDHLDGKLFIDYLSSLKRNILLRKLKKDRRLSADSCLETDENEKDPKEGL